MQFNNVFRFQLEKLSNFYKFFGLKRKNLPILQSFSVFNRKTIAFF